MSEACPTADPVMLAGLSPDIGLAGGFFGVIAGQT